MQYKNLKEKAYLTLKDKIINNELQPNEYLEEKALCDMLGISRTPIREAINRLELDNFVQTVPRKGIFVADLSLQTIREIFQVRKLFEPIVLEVAYNNLDHEVLIDFKEKITSSLENIDYSSLNELDYTFHNYICSMSHNGFLIKIMSNILDHFHRIRTQLNKTTRTETAAKEHLELISFILNDNKVEAINITKEHIINTEKLYFKI